MKPLTLIVMLTLLASPFAFSPNANGEDGRGQDPQPGPLIPYLAANGQFGFTTPDGVLVIQPAYDDAQPFSEQRAAVRQGQRWGYIDTAGHWIVRPTFSNAGDYRQGVARANIVVAATRTGLIDLNPFHHQGKVISYRIDQRGHTLDRWRGDDFYRSPPERKAEAADDDSGVTAAPSPCSDYRFHDFREFTGGYGAVSRPGQGLGVIDRQCRLVVAFRGYDDLRYPDRGFFVGHRETGWGILDAARDVEVVPFDRPDLDAVKILGEGSAELTLAVRRDSLRWDLLDTTGQRVAGDFRAVWGAHENIVAVMDEQGRWGAVTPAGEWIFQPRYDHSFTFFAGLARVTQHGQWFYIDRHGREFRDNAQHPL